MGFFCILVAGGQTEAVGEEDDEYDEAIKLRKANSNQSQDGKG